MEKHIMGENGISYTFKRGTSVLSRHCTSGRDSISDWKVWTAEKDIFAENRKGLYLELVLAGKLNEHLHQIDKECNQMMDRLAEQMKERQGVTEELKMQDQMAWVRRMNNIRVCTEEIILKEIVYR